MINLRIGRQTFDFDCGVKALEMVFEYYGVDMRPDQLMKALKAKENGTSYTNMIELAKKKRGRGICF
jgi:predicted double-glycine peptidase